MNSVFKANISENERMVSMLMGTAFAGIGLFRNSKLLGLLGLGLVARGASGYCPASAALGLDTSARDLDNTKEHLSGSRGVVVEASTRIDRGPDEVYAYWRQLENLPTFMSRIEEVRELQGGRSHWVVKGPLGIRLEWDAEIINDLPGQLLSWKTVGSPDVVSAGSVQFKGEGNGTVVRVKLQYDPPAGKAGATAASMLGEDPQQLVEEDLRRLKGLLEHNGRPGLQAGTRMAEPFAAR